MYALIPIQNARKMDSIFNLKRCSPKGDVPSCIRNNNFKILILDGVVLEEKCVKQNSIN